MTARRLLLVRHGESEWNAQGRWQGRADPTLSDLGRRQAVLAARALAAEPPTVVYSSPLVRASETAAVIAAEVGAGPVRAEADLVERDVGEWSGLTRDDIELHYPGWLDPPADKHSVFGPTPRREAGRRPPGWEPDDLLLARGLRALGRIVDGTPPGTRILVVTHGGLIYVLERHLGAPFARLANLDGRWVLAIDGALSLGDRVRLVDPDEAPVTVPGQL